MENLRTLYTLIYECKNTSSQTFYSLQYIQELNELERLTLIMSHSYDAKSDLYTKNLQEWLLPYVKRRPSAKQQESLLRSYFLKISKDDLNPCNKLLHLRLKQIDEQLFLDINLISILIDCLYENESTDQLDLCKQIANEIQATTITIEAHQKNFLQQPKQQQQQQLNNANKKIIINSEQLEQLKVIQIRLKACDLFKKYDVDKTLSYIQDSCSSEEKCRNSLVKLTWFVFWKFKNFFEFMIIILFFIKGQQASEKRI